jgi:prepilin-type N-terminal cleavage/methylation domain-containing protein
MRLPIADCRLPIAGLSVRRRAAFTLIEIMVVVGIIGLIMAAGAPTLYKVLHKSGFRKTVSDLMEACSSARARAILSQQTTELVFHPTQRTCEVSGGGGGWGNWVTSAKLDDTVRMDGLFVNLTEYTQADEAKVRFFSDGRSDEMLLILTSDKGDQVGITLEITTGLASFLNNDQLQQLRR